MIIAVALKEAVLQLVAHTETAELDAALLLAYVLNVSRSHLYAWPEKQLTPDQVAQFNTLIMRRTKGEPVAYLTGQREFWSLDLKVTPATLIPRPETELLVELVLQKMTGDQMRLVDLGTGSGAIGLALAHEKPNWEILLTDISPEALEIAEQNAERLKLANVQFRVGNWCQALTRHDFDAIVSNPPYIAENDNDYDPKNLRYEPPSALFSGPLGLDATQQIIAEGLLYLKPGGYMFLEHGYQQAESVRNLFKKAGYTDINSYQDLYGRDRVTLARKLFLV